MSFYDVIQRFENFDFSSYLGNVKEDDVLRSLEKEKLNNFDLLNFLSEKAELSLQKMAIKANRITNQYFGKTILLYAPIYISNYCDNFCLYCGFNSKNKIRRRKLSLKEIEKEAAEIRSTGIDHILLLTGESQNKAGFQYIKDAVKILKEYFHSISIEVYPMDVAEYSELNKEGVDGLTIYQEAYDKKVYERVHVNGRKADYKYRLETPERGASVGLRSVNIGSLIGLGDVTTETFFTALHAKYLSTKYLNSEFSISFPRLNEFGTNFLSNNKISDKKFFQLVTAVRLFLPRIGITVSTREPAQIRDKIIHFGTTKLSAGSCTSVGGYSANSATDEQFQISDTRSVQEVSDMLKRSNFQPVFKDWEMI